MRVVRSRVRIRATTRARATTGARIRVDLFHGIIAWVTLRVAASCTVGFGFALG